MTDRRTIWIVLDSIDGGFYGVYASRSEAEAAIAKTPWYPRYEIFEERV